MRQTAVPLALLVVVAILGPATIAESQSGDLPIVSPDYELGPRDSIRLGVVDQPSLTAEYRLSESGTIDLPLVGEVVASGRTARQLERHVEELLAKDFVIDPEVHVQVTAVRSQTVSVLGAVERPGTLGFPGEWTLLEVLAAAGGVTSERGNRIDILRRAENGLSDQVSVPVDALLFRREPKYNLPIFDGDLINVERPRRLSIYFLGEVARAGPLEFSSTERLTLLTAIARIGGLSDRASPRIRIKRRGSDDRMQEIRANYKRILAGEEPDLELQDGDLVLVDESFF